MKTVLLLTTVALLIAPSAFAARKAHPCASEAAKNVPAGYEVDEEVPTAFMSETDKTITYIVSAYIEGSEAPGNTNLSITLNKSDCKKVGTTK